VWNGVLEDMTPLNQLFWLTTKIYRDDSTSEEVGTLETWVNVTGISSFDKSEASEKNLVDNKMSSRTVRCKAGSLGCNEFYIFGEPTVRYEQYNVHIKFRVDADHFTESGTLRVRVDLHTVNSEYSKFELGWKWFFILTTLVVLFLPQEGFLIKLVGVPYRLWSFEQTWVLTLLIALIFFNDPFFAAQLYTKHADSMAILYIFFTASFIGIVLVFWLCVLDEMRSTDAAGVGGRDSGRRSPVTFYTPKLVLVTLIWTILMSTYAYVRTERRGDPTYEGTDDWVLRDIEIVLVTFLLVYCVYLFSLLVLSFSRIVALSPPFKFLFSVTVFVFATVMTGLFAGYFYPLATSAVIFLSFYAIMNFYVWTLAFAYAPLGTDEGYSKGPTAFGEDYFDERGGLAEGQDVMMVGDGRSDSMFEV